MRRIIAVAVIVVAAMAITDPAQGWQRRNRIIIRPQTPNPPGPRGRYVDVDYPSPEKRVANLAELLNLTDDQKQKVMGIFVDQDKDTLALWSDESLTADVRTKKIAELRGSVTRKVRDLLTDDQRKQYDALNPEKPAERIRLQPDPRG